MANQITTRDSSARDLWKMAQALSGSNLLPKHFAGNVANCFLALQMSDRLGLDFFSVAQNLYVVHGTPAFSAKYMIALANQFGPFSGNLKFRTEGTGQSLAVTCYATHAETGEDVEVTVSMAQAKEAGWTKNAKYREIPQQMLSYRAATFLVRLYCPEVTLGVRTVDEVQDIEASEGREIRDVEVEPAAEASDPLSRALAGELGGGVGEAGEPADGAAEAGSDDPAPTYNEEDADGDLPGQERLFSVEENG